MSSLIRLWRLSSSAALVTSFVALLADCSGDGADGAASSGGAADAAVGTDDAHASGRDGSGSNDATTSDVVQGPRCDPTKPFGTPMMVLKDSFVYDQSARLSPDELTVYFAGSGGNEPAAPTDLWFATRTSTSVPFQNPTRITELSMEGIELYPTVTADGLTIYFEGYGEAGRTIFRATRSAPTATWDPPTALTGLELFMPYVSPDGTRLYGAKEMPGGPPYNADIYYVDLPYAGGASTVVPGTASPGLQYWPVASADGLALYSSYPLLGPYRWELGVAKRASTSMPFGATERVPELDDDAGDESATWISPDGCTIYFRRINANVADNASGLFQVIRGQ